MRCNTERRAVSDREVDQLDLAGFETGERQEAVGGAGAQGT